MAMDNSKLVAAHRLKSNWSKLVLDGDMSDDELLESLRDQVNGYVDMSMDELDEDFCNILGWDLHNVTDSQTNEWQGIVNTAACEYIDNVPIDGDTLDALADWFVKKDCIACGGNWTGMLITGVKAKFPKAYASMPDGRSYKFTDMIYYTKYMLIHGDTEWQYFDLYVDNIVEEIDGIYDRGMSK